MPETEILEQVDANAPLLPDTPTAAPDSGGLMQGLELSPDDARSQDLDKLWTECGGGGHGMLTAAADVDDGMLPELDDRPSPLGPLTPSPMMATIGGGMINEANASAGPVHPDEGDGNSQSSARLADVPPRASRPPIALQREAAVQVTPEKLTSPTQTLSRRQGLSSGGGSLHSSMRCSLAGTAASVATSCRRRSGTPTAGDDDRPSYTRSTVSAAAKAAVKAEPARASSAVPQAVRKARPASAIPTVSRLYEPTAAASLRMSMVRMDSKASRDKREAEEALRRSVQLPSPLASGNAHTSRPVTQPKPFNLLLALRPKAPPQPTTDELRMMESQRTKFKARPAPSSLRSSQRLDGSTARASMGGVRASMPSMTVCKPFALASMEKHARCIMCAVPVKVKCV